MREAVPRRVDPRNVEVMDERMVAVYRSKTGAERLRIADGMFRFARDLVAAGIRDAHPDWPDELVQREAARRMLNVST